MTQISFINRLDGLPDEDLKDLSTGALDQDWLPPSCFPDNYKSASVISMIFVATIRYGTRVVAICQRRQY